MRIIVYGFCGTIGALLLLIGVLTFIRTLLEWKLLSIKEEEERQHQTPENMIE